MKFKCKATNLVYNFEFEVDIASMMKHPDYEKVDETEEVPTATSKPAKKSVKAATPANEEPVEGN